MVESMTLMLGEGLITEKIDRTSQAVKLVIPEKRFEIQLVRLA